MHFNTCTYNRQLTSSIINFLLVRSILLHYHVQCTQIYECKDCHCVVFTLAKLMLQILHSYLPWLEFLHVTVLTFSKINSFAAGFVTPFAITVKTFLEFCNKWEYTTHKLLLVCTIWTDFIWLRSILIADTFAMLLY